MKTLIKLLTTLLIINCTLLIASAQPTYQWAFDIGAGWDDWGYGIAVDSSGNTYVTGFFEDIVDFDPGAGTTLLNSGGGGQHDIYVAKYNSGGAYQWAFNIGGGGDGYGIAVDGSGNCYVTGFFGGINVDFDPGPDSAFLNGSGDIFVAKYNSNGAYQWAFDIGGAAGSGIGYGIAVDGSGNCYVTGYFYGTNIDFDPGTDSAFLTSPSFDDDIFIAKYDASGAYQWAFNLGGTVDDEGYAIAADGSGNCYVTGVFRGTADFDPGAGTANLSSAVGGYDLFAAKYDASGNYLWAFNIGGTGTERGYGIAVDGSDNSYITGYFMGTNIDFDPGAGTANLSSVGNADIFAAKYDANGNYLWAFNIGGTTNDDEGYDIALDGSGNFFVTGKFRDTADFDPGAGTANLISEGWADIFVAKYSSGGAYQWAFGVGEILNDRGYGIGVDGSGNCYVTGSFFQTTIDFDPGPGTANLSSAGISDIFVAKYDGGGVYIDEINTREGQIAVYPNPFSNSTVIQVAEGTENKEYSFELYDIMGKKTLTQSLTVGSNVIKRGKLSSGLYIYKVLDGDVTIQTGKLAVE